VPDRGVSTPATSPSSVDLPLPLAPRKQSLTAHHIETVNVQQWFRLSVPGEAQRIEADDVFGQCYFC
jgi:hypothetical protein